MLFALVISTVVSAGAKSAGSCYDHTTHNVECNVAEGDCGGSWYAPGFVSDHSKCCHCKGSCKSLSDECEYYDESGGHHGDGHETSAGSCYDSGTHDVACNVADGDCEGSWYEPGFVSSRSGCCHCKASCSAPDDECDYYDVSKEEETVVDDSIGSCYDMQVTHTIDCGVTAQSCMDIEGVWYAEGHVSTYGGTPCCHCQPECPPEGQGDDCTFYDSDEYMTGTKKEYIEKYCNIEDVPDTPKCAKFQPTPAPVVPESGAFAMLGLAWLVF